MFNQYPYLNLNDLNLDYLLNELKSMYNEVTNFVSINAIKYADPIQWNITSQYEKNTVVIDPLTGTAYISVAAVPSGVALTRTEYWTVVFDLGSFVTRAAQNFTSHWESDTTTTATFSTSTGGWLVWGDVLYKALTNITAGDSYVVGSNIEHFTIEDLYNTYLNTIAQILATVGDLDDLKTADTSTIVNAINSVSNAINVLSIGFDNTGVIDNTSAFNRLSNGIYYLPNGTYKVDGSVSLSHDVTLIGESISGVIISLTNNNTSEIVTTNNTNVLISNLSMVGLRTDNNLSSILSCLGNAVIEKCYFETHSPYKIAIACNGSFQNRYIINNCEINGNGGNGDFGVWCDSTGGVDNVCILAVSNCFIHGFHLNGVFSTARVGRYTNNRFLDNHYQTTPTGGGQIDVLSNNLVPISVHLVENNIIEGGAAGACGVEISNCKAIVKNNTIYGGSLTNTFNNGVVVQLSTDSIIEGNSFQQCYSGIRVNSDACANIINNTFYAMGAAGCIHVDTELNEGNMIVGNISKLSQPVITYGTTNRPLYELYGSNSSMNVGLMPNDSVTFKLPSAMSTTDDNYFITIMFDSEVDTIYAMYEGTIFRDSSKMQTLSIVRNGNALTCTSNAVGGRLLAIKLL